MIWQFLLGRGEYSPKVLHFDDALLWKQLPCEGRIPELSPKIAAPPKGKKLKAITIIFKWFFEDFLN